MRLVPYSKMENICYGPIKGYGSLEPDWGYIAFMVERFSKDETDPRGIMQRFSEWLSEAKEWYKGNPERIKAFRQSRVDSPLPPRASWTKERIEHKRNSSSVAQCGSA